MTELRVAMIGTAFMGRAHSHAWRTAPRFFDLGLTPRMSLIAGADAARTEAAAASLGWDAWTTDWRDAIERDDVDLVDICTPGTLHEEIAIAALDAGKHVLCEKPLANDVAAAERMTAAAERAAASGVFAMCGFSYRRTPALALARDLVAEGALGEIRHVRAQYLQDWLSDPRAPMSWRLDRDLAGSGSLGDIGAHSIDTVQWLLGDRIADVSARLRTFVTERPQPAQRADLGGRADAEAPLRRVTVDDAAVFTAQLEGGALGVFEATRFATGRRNANRVELNGELGSIAFDFERMNELEYFDARDGRAVQGFRRIQVSDAIHPYTGNWWPVGHGLGYDHLFVNQVADLVRDLAAGIAPQPDFASALDVQRVLAAVAESADNDSRVTPVRREGTR